MGVDFENITDRKRWKLTVERVGEILQIDPANIENYFVLAYDGTPELKADTDIPEVGDVVLTLQVFLEHITGMKVRFED